MPDLFLLLYSVSEVQFQQSQLVASNNMGFRHILVLIQENKKPFREHLLPLEFFS